MDDHQSRADLVHRAIIDGQLPAARDPALWLAAHEEHSQLPQGVKSPVEDVRAFARSITRSASLADAARCASEMAAACGRCHEAAGADLRFAGPTMPPTGQRAAPHMLRHAWATNQMWRALLSRSDALWQAGATALSEDPLFHANDESGREVVALARDVHLLGSQARRIENPDHRAGIYGRLLSTCADCHTLLGVSTVVADGGRP
jgi:cytochrome c553